MTRARRQLSLATRAVGAALLALPCARAQEPELFGPPPPIGAAAADPTRAVDESDAAAAFLRRKLGLSAGPGGFGPPIPPDFVPPGPPQPRVRPPVQDPKPAPPPPRVDETDTARGALERIIPRAEPAREAPLPVVPPLRPAPELQDPARPATGELQDPTRPVDPTQRAGELLQRVLPEAKPPDSTLAPDRPQPEAPLDWTQADARFARGRASLRYRGREGDGDSDHDLIAYLDLDLGSAERDPISAHVSGRGYADLDGHEDDGNFNGLDETLGDVVLRLYEAYLDVHAIDELEVLRVGRQPLVETPVELSFDGLRAESARFSAIDGFGGAYVGVPVHHYESSHSGDLVVGLNAGASPWEGARLRADFMHLEDELRTSSPTDDLFGISLRQRLLEHATLFAKQTWRDGDPRDFVLRGRGELVDLGLDLNAGYRELLTAQRALVTELDPFHDVLLEEQPYRLADLELTKDLSETVSVAVGGAVRRLADLGDEGQFNREYERVWLRPMLDDLWVDGLSLAISAEAWRADGDAVRSLAGDLSWRVDDSLRFSLGTAYDLYKYDSFTGIEREHVRSWYLRVVSQPQARLRLDGGYEIESAEGEHFHLFRVGITWSF
ncbi:MAG: hypothetical protein IT457_21480 [Planctomycetes bacterium]|nr:hypothetical protein [Planctomycetota bacterium]